MKKIFLIISVSLLLVSVMSCGEPSGPFKVIYHSDGSTSGLPPTDPKDYKSGDHAKVLGKNTLVKTEYKFAGWNTKTDYSGDRYNEGDEIVIKNITIFLFPVWEAE
jgi:hypothetical protein